MTLLQVQHVSKSFGDQAVLTDVQLDVRAGDRVALVGPNGAGKSTLLRILTGELSPDSGESILSPRARVGYVQQHLSFEDDATIWTQACSSVGDLADLVEKSERVSKELAEEQNPSARDALLLQYDKIQAELQQRDAYQWEHHVERVLMGMGFPRSTFDTPVHLLSGGQRNRLMLACVMVAQPDLLILDEPSNHLDVETTEWLEDSLAETSSALLVVSHDRYFLDRVCNRVAELWNGTIDTYVGNYSAYVRQKAERLEVQRRTYERQQIEIEKLEDFVRRNHYGQKSAQAEDRRKKLERIERVEPPREISAPKFRFQEPTRTGDIVIRCERLSKAFGKLKLFEELSFDVLRGERWAILGSNGTGKTTLLRCLLGRESLDAGRVLLGSGVNFAYFDQLLAEVDLNLTPLEFIRVPGKERVDVERRNILAAFGITGDLVFKPMRSLSGGERNRTMMARLSALEPNLLILDEPTNHLDLWSRESLENALRAFDGTVLLVTHDRYFVNAVADHVLVLRDGRAHVLQGNYNDYRDWVRSGLAVDDRGTGWSDKRERTQSTPAASEGNPKSERANSTASKKRKFPYRKRSLIESDISQAEEELDQHHATMLLPEVLRDGRRVKELQAQIESLRQKIEQLYEHYEEALERND